MSVLTEIFIVFLLVLLNGFFAMCELALVSSRRPRLTAMADQGSRGARQALELLQHPSRFLSTVQIGITLIGVLAGAYSGATLAEPFALYLMQFALIAEFAEGIAVAIVVAGITYASLIIGELVPKQIALKNPERIAVVVAYPMTLIAKLAAPLVWFLGLSSHFVLKLLRMHGKGEQRVTQEEVKAVLEEGVEAGVLHPEEQKMLEGVMRLADQRVGALLTPRPDVIWLDTEDDLEVNRQKILNSGHSRFPVAAGDLDHLLGVAEAKVLLNACLNGQSLDMRRLVTEPPVLHDRASALAAIRQLKASPMHMAIVVDEYGSCVGIITAADILSAIVGYMPQPALEDKESQAQQRDDGSWLLDGGMAVDDVKQLLGLKALPGEQDFYTLAGSLLHQFGDLPKPGAAILWSGWRFEVVDMDGNRIDKVLALQVDPPMENIDL